MIQFDLPKEQSSIIKVIGVGGGGSNAVNHMFSQNIEGVNFIICNTDAQAIALSKVPNKIQLGPHLTQGLGAGANPAIGRQATEESLEEIKRILEVNTKMAFITAGMGGGTGTGGAPILAKICKDLGILTVGIVTTPFAYEGKKRIAQAEEGINLLKDHVDTLLVISNDKLRHAFGNLKMKEAFAKADNVLATAAKCITDVINSTGQINVDFADVCTVMSKGGVAILGSAAAQGDNRAQEAIETALNSPLLNDNDIRGAKWILININSAEGEHEFTMDEVEIIQNHLLSSAGEDTDVILGLGYDNTLGNQIGITLIATGFDHKNPFEKKQPTITAAEKEEKIMMVLEMPSKENNNTKAAKAVQQPTLQFDEFTHEQNTAPQTESLSSQLHDMEPTLIEQPLPISSPVFSNKKDEEIPIFFEISSGTDQTPTMQYTEQPMPDASENNIAPQQDKPLTGLVKLAKPTQIYAPEMLENASTETEPPMQLIFKENLPQPTPKDAEKIIKIEEDAAPQPQTLTPLQIESTWVQDETEELRKRAADRITKLRNLSFNINAADPNNEFETVPAYLRRNLELHNSIAEVENFYSNYTVKANDNNQAEISNSLNSFLEGKKPD